jgi:hypothetical protein
MGHKYRNVPITAAKVVAEKYQKNQVIIVCWDDVHKKTHITTYGATKRECREAAIGGQKIREALGLEELKDGRNS